MDKTTEKGSLGIIVSGGPAPGINHVIFSAVREAMNNSWKVYGAQDGFGGINAKRGDAWLPLEEVHLLTRDFLVAQYLELHVSIPSRQKFLLVFS
ncbi:MAG: 6-phosphofructokinase [Bdellovibrionota bacterium]